VATAFGRWKRREQIAVDDLNNFHIAAFLKRSPRRRKSRAKFELAALRPLLGHLLVEAGVPTPPPQIGISPADDLARRYRDYLRNDRGLTENSVHATRTALARYSKRRDERYSLRRTEAFLVSERNRRLQSCTARHTFARMSCAIGLGATTGSRRIVGGPRLQEFRHSFARSRLWYRAGLDIQRELPKLATYLGHVDIGHTYRYIEAVPELLQLATEHLRERQPGGEG
jgi:hypothetical protein